MIYKTIKFLINTALSLVVGVSLVFSVCTAISQADLLNTGNAQGDVLGYLPLIVKSDSMQPVFNAGDVVLTKLVEDKSDVEVGDIVSYKMDANNIVIHRVIGINPDGTYQFQGDANEMADANPITYEQLQAEYLFAIPYLGYILVNAKTGPGFIALVVVFVIALWLYEKIFDKLDKIFLKRQDLDLALAYDKQLDEKYGINEAINEDEVKMIDHKDNSLAVYKEGEDNGKTEV